MASVLIPALETFHGPAHDWPSDWSLDVTRASLPQSSSSVRPFTLSAFCVSGSFQGQLDAPPPALSLSPFLDTGSL